ncbi:MAG: hypothetical protein ACYTEE_06265 [Planctomycetota bacterium]
MFRTPLKAAARGSSPSFSDRLELPLGHPACADCGAPSSGKGLEVQVPRRNGVPLGEPAWVS